MRWNLRQIEVFVAVVEEGGFTAAGERLHMVQPAVSIAIRKLEQSVGVQLLDRSGARALPTREGEIFLRHVQRIHSEFSNLERQLRELRSLDSGQVIIGAPPIVTSFLLPPLIGKFLKRHPGVEVSAVTGPSEGIVRRLREHTLDIAVIAGEHDTSDLEAVLIDQQPIVACSARESPISKLKEISWDRLLDEPLVSFSKGYNQRTIVDRMAGKIGREPRIAVESESAQFICAMVAAGRGVSVALGAVVREFPDLVLIPIAGRPTLPVWLCRRAEGVSGIAANALFDSIAGSAKRRKSTKK
ncbi:MAG TPA: LysR family transcriptional regulator [Burkholderiales bacterium]|jgi:DNA-binding transcriptional LysR family regulator